MTGQVLGVDHMRGNWKGGTVSSAVSGIAVEPQGKPKCAVMSLIAIQMLLVNGAERPMYRWVSSFDSFHVIVKLATGK